MIAVNKRLPLILIVDDDADFFTIVSNKLTYIAQFVSVGNLAAAIAYLANYNPSLMLLDNYLPDGLGAEFIGECRMRYPEVKVIMVSADADPKLRRQCLDGGASLFFVKPFDIETLRKNVVRVLNEGRPEFGL